MSESPFHFDRTNTLEARAGAPINECAGGVGAFEVREAEAAARIEPAAGRGAEHAVVVPVAAEGGGVGGAFVARGDGDHGQRGGK